MYLTTVRLERPEGTPLLDGISVQIEGAAPRELAVEDLGGARPFDLIWLYTTAGVPSVPLRRRDVLFDEVNLDPETDLPAKYRVVGLVETLLDDHQEALCERVVGG